MATAVFITNVGGYVRKDRELSALRIKEGELEAIVSGRSRSTQQAVRARHHSHPTSQLHVDGSTPTAPHCL